MYSTVQVLGSKTQNPGVRVIVITLCVSNVTYFLKKPLKITVFFIFISRISILISVFLIKIKRILISVFSILISLFSIKRIKFSFFSFYNSKSLFFSPFFRYFCVTLRYFGHLPTFCVAFLRYFANFCLTANCVVTYVWRSAP